MELCIYTRVHTHYVCMNMGAYILHFVVYVCIFQCQLDRAIYVYIYLYILCVCVCVCVCDGVSLYVYEYVRIYFVLQYVCILFILCCCMCVCIYQCPLNRAIYVCTQVCILCVCVCVCVHDGVVLYVYENMCIYSLFSYVCVCIYQCRLNRAGYVYIYYILCVCVCVCVHDGLVLYVFEYTRAHMGCLRSVGSNKLQVSFAEHRLFNRALLQKRPIILSILLSKATPQSIFLYVCVYILVPIKSCSVCIYKFVNTVCVCCVCVCTMELCYICMNTCVYILYFCIYVYVYQCLLNCAMSVCLSMCSSFIHNTHQQQHF